MTTVERVKDIQYLAAQVAEDAEKFDKGNGAAGTRVRKAMQEIKAISQDVRKHVLEVKESR